MDSHTRALLEAVGEKSSFTFAVGEYVGVEDAGTTVVVSTGEGSFVRAKSATEYRPEPLEQVIVAYIDGQAWLWGSATSKPGRGTVTSVSGGVATVATDVGDVVCSYAATPGVGNRVKLTWQDGPHILGHVGTFPEQAEPPAEPEYTPTAHTHIFHAAQSGMAIYPGPYPGTAPGKWRPGSFLIPSSGDATIPYAFWFYSDLLAQTIPPQAAVQSVEVYFPPSVGAWGIIGVFPYASPDDAITQVPEDTAFFYPGDVDWGQRGAGVWLPYPTDLAGYLIDGTVALGPALGGGGPNEPPNTMKGLDIYGDGTGDPLSGAIRITATY